MDNFFFKNSCKSKIVSDSSSIITVFCALFLVLFSFQILSAQDSDSDTMTQTQSWPTTPGDYPLTFKSSWDGSPQPFRLFLPKDFKSNEQNVPVVFVLHGKGVDENAWFDYTTVKEYGDKFGCILMAPLGRGNYWYRGSAEQDVLDLVEIIKEQYPVDESRVYMMGHSMGGWGTFWISSRNPGIFSAVAPMSGFWADDMTFSGANMNPFLIHCETDDIVPVEYSRSIAKRFSEYGFNHRYREEHTYGHASSLISDNFDRLFPWLLEHELNPSPYNVSHAVRTPLKGRSFWVEVLETTSWPETGTIEAKYINEELIINTTGIERFSLHHNQVPFSRAAEIQGKLNNQPFTIPVSILEKPNSIFKVAEKKIEGVDNAPKPVIHSDIAEKYNEMVANLDQDQLTIKLGEMLAKEEGADFGLFREEDFIPANREATFEDLLNTFAYPVEEGVLINTTPKQILAWSEEHPSKQFVVKHLANKFEDHDKNIKVLTPINTALALGVEFSKTPGRFDEKLLRIFDDR